MQSGLAQVSGLYSHSGKSKSWPQTWHLSLNHLSILAILPSILAEFDGFVEFLAPLFRNPIEDFLAGDLPLFAP